MRIVLSLLAALLLSSSLSARAEGDDKSKDLRYCLELESPYEIAKCSGEVAPGAKRKTYSPEKVEKILEEEKQRSPTPTEEKQAPATETEKPGTAPPPEQTESN